MAETATEPLTDRLIRAQIGSCTCDVMTPHVGTHDPMCRYRIAADALDEIEILRGLLQEVMDDMTFNVAPNAGTMAKIMEALANG